MRLRQLVFASGSPDTAGRLAELLDLGAAYKDPGVKAFGLDNAVFALGDQFLEIVWPIADTAPAQRFLDRRGGDGGYMAIFETAHLEKVRRAARDGGVRSVWTIDMDDIKATHFHPADVGAAIVSVDQPRVAGEWPWGGPDWRANAAPGGLAGAVMTAPDPQALADRWGLLLGYGTQETQTGARIKLEGAELVFERDEDEALVGFKLVSPDPDGVFRRAEAMGLAVQPGGVTFAGVLLEISPD